MFSADKEYEITKNFFRLVEQSKKRINENYQLRPEDKEYEEDQFKDAMNVPVDFGNLYEENNVIYFNGVIKYNGLLRWKFDTSGTDEITISTESLKLDDEMVEIINKLQAYYKSWSDKWIKRING